MNKQEAKEFLKEKRDEGYITYSMLLDLFPGDITEKDLETMYHLPKEKHMVLWMGTKMHQLLNKMWKY